VSQNSDKVDVLEWYERKLRKDELEYEAWLQRKREFLASLRSPKTINREPVRLPYKD
jgi:hypothetical protein